jgi:diadenylate cyclase
MRLDHVDCDISPMKRQIKGRLTEIVDEIEHSANAIDNETNCLLANFAEIRRKVIEVESTAASFYLNCYLSGFTDKYTELSISVQNLSKRRHGALMVVKRNDSLENWIQPGVPIHATLTYSLVESIFYPGSPLHDGALLVKGDEIVSATHVLPLSNTVTGQVKLGTRHRAALGLSEQSDALILVVSEETGQVSFAFEGKLHPINP